MAFLSMCFNIIHVMWLWCFFHAWLETYSSSQSTDKIHISHSVQPRIIPASYSCGNKEFLRSSVVDEGIFFLKFSLKSFVKCSHLRRTPDFISVSIGLS